MSFTTADLSPVPAKTVNDSAAEPDTRRFWHCPVCGVWAPQTDSYGNVRDHFSTYGSCFGSGEPTAFTVRALLRRVRTPCRVGGQTGQFGGPCITAAEAALNCSCLGRIN